MNGDNYLVEFARDLVQVQSDAMRAGAEAGRTHTHPYLNAIFVAYDRAKDDPQAKIPSVLMMAIENARHALGDCAPTESPYADRRREPRLHLASDTESSPDGRTFRAGE